MTTDEAKCKPTVSGAVVDTNAATIALTGDENTLVRYCSNALCTISTTLNKSAGSIKAKTINNVAVSGNTLTIANVETGVFDFYAKDSREYFNSDKVVKALVEYIKLTCNASAQRTDPTSGNATLSIEGNYFNGNFGAASNSLTVKYREGTGEYIDVTPTTTGNRYTATVSLTGLDYTKAFNFEVVVSDKLNSVTKTLTIKKAIPVFDWGEEDFNFNVPVSLPRTHVMETYGKGGLNLNNSDVTGANAVYFNDAGNATREGLMFPRNDDTTMWDRFNVLNGRATVMKNCPMDGNILGAGTAYTLLDTETVADYIVEQGKKNKWTYRKWNSGIMECWASVQITTDVSNTWGNLYTSGAISATDLTYPYEFAELPYLTVSLMPFGVGGLIMAPGSTYSGNTQTGAFEIARGASTTNAKYLFAYHAIGRWK